MTRRQAAYTGINRYADNASLNSAPAGSGDILYGVVRSIELVSGFAKHPNNMLNPARSARWTALLPQGCRLA
jgi:hypothetical protein